VAVVYYIKTRKARILILVFLITLAGLLTHYHFLLFLAFLASATVWILLVERNYRPIIFLSACFLGAMVAFVAIHSNFLDSFVRSQEQAQSFLINALYARIDASIRAFFMVFAPLFNEGTSRLFRYITYVIFVGLAFALVTSIVDIARQEHFRLTKFRGVQWLPTIVTILTWGAIVLLYLSFISPAHAMDARYLMLVTPVLFVSIGQLIDYIIRRYKFAPLLIGFLVVWQLGNGIIYTVKYALQDGQKAAPSDLQTLTPLVLDSTARGILPTILWHVNSERAIYAGSQDELLQNFPPISPDTQTIIYVSNLDYGNSEDKRQALLDRFEIAGFNLGCVDISA